MSAFSPQEVTQLLVAWSNGDRAALDEHYIVLYLFENALVGDRNITGA